MKNNITEEITDLENEITSEPFRVEFDCAEYYGYPAYYSASADIYEAPIGNIRLENNTDEILDTVITISAEPSFFEKVTVTADEIKKNSVCEFKCPKLKQDPSALAFLPRDTAVKYTVSVTGKDGTLLAEKSVMARLASISSWGGVHCMPETAASFVSCDCDDVKELAERARKLYGSYGTDGYEGKTSDDIRHLFAAAYEAIREMRITYSSGAFYPDEKGVFVSPPELTLHKKCGNSMELALVIVSVLKSLGMNTVLCFTAAATLPGVFTEDISFSVPVNDDIDEITEIINDGRLVLIDPASVIKGINVSFDTAEERALEALKRNDKYYLTLDMTACGERGIRSLPPRTVTEDGLFFADESTGVPEDFFAVGGEEDEFEPSKRKTRSVTGKRRVLNRGVRLAGRAVSIKNGSYYDDDGCYAISVPAEKLYEDISIGRSVLFVSSKEEPGKDALLTNEKISFIGDRIKAYEASRYTRSTRDELLLSFCPVTYKDEAKGHYYTAPLCFVPVRAFVDEKNGTLSLEKATPNQMILNTVLTERLDKLFGTDLYDIEKYGKNGFSETVKYIKDKTFGFSRSEIFVNEKDAFLEFADITAITALRSSFKDKMSHVRYSDKVTAQMYNAPSGISGDAEDTSAAILLGRSAHEAFKRINGKEDAFVRSDSRHSKAAFAFKVSKEAADRGERVLYVSDSLRSAGMLKSYYDAFGAESIYRDEATQKTSDKKLYAMDKIFLDEDIFADSAEEAFDVSKAKADHDAYLKAIVKKHPIALSFLSSCKGYFQQYDSSFTAPFDGSRLGKMTREDTAELFSKVSEYLYTAEELLERLKKDGEYVNIFDTPLNKVYMTSSSEEESKRLYENASELCGRILGGLDELKDSYASLTEFIFGVRCGVDHEKTEELCGFASLLVSSEKAGRYVMPQGSISMYADARIALSLLGEARELKKGREIFGEELTSLPQLPPDPVTFRDSYEESKRKGFFAKKGAKSTLLKQFENLLSDPSLVSSEKAEVYTNRLAEAYELENKADINTARAIFGDNEDSAVMEEMAEILFRLAEGAERITELFADEAGKDASRFMSENVRNCLLKMADPAEKERIRKLIKSLSESKINVSSNIRQLTEMLFMKDAPTPEKGIGYEETEEFFRAFNDSVELLPLWCEWRYANVTAREYGFDGMTKLFAENIISADEARNAFVKGFYRTVCDHIIENSDALREFSAENYSGNTEKLIGECKRLEAENARKVSDDNCGKVIIAAATDIPAEFFGKKAFDLVIFDDAEAAPASLLSPVMALGENCLILSLEKEGRLDERLPYDTQRVLTEKKEKMSAASLASRIFDTYYRADGIYPYFNERSLSFIEDNGEEKTISLIKAEGMCLASPDSFYPEKTDKRADDIVRSSYTNSAESIIAVDTVRKLLASDSIASCVIYTLTEAQRKLIQSELEKNGLTGGEKPVITSVIESPRILPCDAVIFSTVLSVPDSSVFPSVLPSGGGVLASTHGEKILAEIMRSARRSFTVITSLDEKNLSASAELFDPYASLKRALRKVFFSEKSTETKCHEKAFLSPAAEHFAAKGGSRDSVFDENILVSGDVTSHNRVYTAQIYKNAR